MLRVPYLQKLFIYSSSSSSSSSSPKAAKALKALVCLSEAISLGSTAFELPKFLLLGLALMPAPLLLVSLNLILSSMASPSAKEPFLGLDKVAQPSSSTTGSDFFLKFGRGTPEAPLDCLLQLM